MKSCALRDSPSRPRRRAEAYGDWLSREDTTPRGVSLRGGTTICRVAKKTKGDLMEGWVTEGEGELKGATKKGRETVASKQKVLARRVIPLQRKFDFWITKK